MVFFFGCLVLAWFPNEFEHVAMYTCLELHKVYVFNPGFFNQKPKASHRTFLLYICVYTYIYKHIYIYICICIYIYVYNEAFHIHSTFAKTQPELSRMAGTPLEVVFHTTLAGLWQLFLAD